MPNPLAVQNYHDDFQVITELLVTPANGIAVFYAERDTVIDAVYYGVSVVGGALSTLQLAKTTTGTLTTPASASAAVIQLGTALHTAQAVSSLGTFNPALTTPGNDTNLVKAGNWLGIIVGGTIGTPTILLQLRIRSRVA